MKKISKDPDTSTFNFSNPKFGEYNSKEIKFILDKFSKKVLNEKLIEDIMVVSNEFIANIMDQGNHNDSNKKIKISCL